MSKAAARPPAWMFAGSRRVQNHETPDKAPDMDLAPTELQLDILCILWTRGEATVTEVHDLLSDDREVTPSTIHTLLARLEGRGLVAHRSDGKRHYFRAAVHREQVAEAVVLEFCQRTRRLFRGQLSRAVDWLLKVEQVDAEERTRVVEVLEGAEPTLGGTEGVREAG